MHVEVDGLRLFVDVLSPEYVPEGPTMRRRPSVVFLHGGIDGDSSNSRAIAEQLTGVACVVLTDRRGNGRSDGGGNPSTWTLERFADDVHDVCVTLGLVHPIVVGSSYGGFIALQYAIRHPKHPGGLVVLSSGPRFDRERLMNHWQEIDRGRDPAETARIAERSARVVRRRKVEAYPPDLFMLDLDLRPALGTITCPLLAVIGDADPIFPIALSEEIVNGISSSDRQLLQIPGAGHMLDISAAPEVAEALRAFVTRIGAADDPWQGGTAYDA